MIAGIPAVKPVSGTADGSLYTGGGLITCIAIDPEENDVELTVRDGTASGTYLGSVSASTDGQTNHMTFGGGVSFEAGIYIQISGVGRAVVYYRKKA
jgi:hypothetical protein